MIRLLIAGLMLLMAGNANAFSNKDIYLYCKAFAEKNFEPENIDDAICFSYIAGAGEAAQLNCLLETKSGIPYNPKGLEAVVQHYVNEMKNRPEVWETVASLEVWKSLRSINGTDCPPKK